MQELIRASQEKMEAIIQSIWSERDETIQQRGENVMTRVNHETQSLQKVCQETTACHKTTEMDTKKIQPDPRMVHSAAEHQEVPKEDAIVKPVKGRKKRHRGRKLAAGRRGDPNELIQGICGSRKLAAACRKVSRCTRMAWRKGNVFRKYSTRDNVEQEIRNGGKDRNAKRE
jgi:hypothetical protein